MFKAIFLLNDAIIFISFKYFVFIIKRNAFMFLKERLLEDKFAHGCICVRFLVAVTNGTKSRRGKRWSYFI